MKSFGEMNYSDDIRQSVEILRAGGVILYPTDTIWGLGCDATNQKAVEKIFSIKSREENKSLIILADSEAMIERYVREVPQIAYELLSVADKPLTIIYPEGKNLAPGVCSSDGSIGIRLCTDDFCRELIGRFRKPLVSTSANFSGKASPACFDEIDPELIALADYTVQHRRDDYSANQASSIIKLGSDGTIRIIRK